MRTTRPTLVALLLLAGALNTGTVHALPTVTELQCALEDTIEQSYGLTLSPSPSEFESTGSGTLTCTGVVDGVEVEGTGPLHMSGSTSDTWCGAGSGTIEFTARVPRRDGRGHVRLEGTQAWNRVGLVLATRSTSGVPASGPMYAQPLNGDCHETPVTLVRLRAPALVTTG